MPFILLQAVRASCLLCHLAKLGRVKCDSLAASLSGRLTLHAEKVCMLLQNVPCTALDVVQQGCLMGQHACVQVKHKVMSEGILAWIAEQGLEGELGGPQGVLRMVLRALLVAGSKSFTHMITALERYCLILQTLLAQTGPQVLGPALPSGICGLPCSRAYYSMSSYSACSCSFDSSTTSKVELMGGCYGDTV